MTADPHAVLKKVWGYSAFRPMQESIIGSVLSGHDTLALLPTGGGKSLCYQVPALCMEGLCIVISPLIALMKDQTDALVAKGVKAKALHSGLSFREIDVLLDNCVYGDIKLLYVSPERLASDLFLARLQKMKVSLLAVDEAHCISQWGYDFRPAYLSIATIRDIVKAPCLALTASATPAVKTDIADKLKLNNHLVFADSHVRKNLSLSVFKTETKEAKMLEVLKGVPGSAIVYTMSRRKTVDVAGRLSRHGITAGAYHAGLSKTMRDAAQESWLHNRTRVVVATNAFGMGIDKPDVRSVIHLDVPDSPEAYYQEAGRAGRDGKTAFAVLLYDENDLNNARERFGLRFPPPEFLRSLYQKLANHFAVPTEAEQVLSFELDVDAFVKKYDLNPSACHYGLKALEATEAIAYSEAVFVPSRLKFTKDSTGVYDFMLRYPALEGWVKTLLRLYGGELFTDYITIKEEQLAKASNRSFAEVEKALNDLVKFEMADYRPRSDLPRIHFMPLRPLPENLKVNNPLQQELKKTAEAKMNAIHQYMQLERECRFAIISEYFGEKSLSGCGMCDVCIQKRKELKAERNDLGTALIDCLKIASRPVEELEQLLKPRDVEAFHALIKKMLDAGEISVNRNGWLCIQN